AGTPVGGRTHPDVEPLIGMFVNTLPLRNRPIAGTTFTRFLKDVTKNTLEAFENQEYQLEDLVQHLEVERDASRNPLFDVMFVLHTMKTQQAETKELRLNPREYYTGTAKFDMTISAAENGERLDFELEYCTSLFKEENIKRFIRYFKKIIAHVLQDTLQKINEIEIISNEEKKKILFDFNGREVEYPVNKTIHQLFEEQVTKNPDGISTVGPALSAVGRRVRRTDPEQALQAADPGVGRIHEPTLQSMQLSYRELNRQSNRLAALLKNKGVKPGTIVAIKTERSVEMIIGLLGILKTGSAYLPIDTGTPEERITYMLKDSNAGILLVDDTTPNDRNSNDQNQERGTVVLNLTHLVSEYLESEFDSETGFSFSETAAKPSAVRHPATGPAYIIYTSGSTGKPKGV
ncbi:MAG: AMP-binding protein, partial [bacterium]|nr:AMP-binding protein [bacterium]